MESIAIRFPEAKQRLSDVQVVKLNPKQFEFVVYLLKVFKIQPHDPEQYSVYLDNRLAEFTNQ